ncbi:MAG: TonB family protein [Bacteroidetes bacterium]|nr:TonB family protein [Bacteroidota bacterium]
MKPEQIPNADFLDIVFDGRNKDYGAYQLRRSYNHRLLLALIAPLAFTGAIFAADYVARRSASHEKVAYNVVDVQLMEAKPVDKTEPIPPPPPPPPPKMAPQKLEITKFTPPRIVKDNEVKEDEKPPEQEKLQDTRIGAINQEGAKDEGITGPPTTAENGKGLISTPSARPVEDYEKTFVKVEIESEYPGGAAAWLRYLNKNMRYPEDGLNNEIQGTVIVQFIVDKEGNVSEVEAISGPETGGLREEAIRVIKKSGNWLPAIQNGRKVKSYKKQPVIFKLVNQ